MPFPEMQGDIVYLDYERSYKAEGLEAFKIGGQSPPVYDTIVLFIDVQLKGGGSAYGGKRRPNPNKPADQRYVGTPGEIKTTIMPNGDVFKQKNWSRLEKLLWNGIIQYIIGQISILIHMIMKYDGTPQMDILNRSLLLIIPMEHRNSNNMEDEKRWETFYMYQTTEA